VDKISRHLSEIEAEQTAHGSGSKYVFLSNDEMDSPLTQIAYGKFLPGEVCAEHFHATMDECFFFLKGKGVYQIGEEQLELKPETFLRIPAGIKHRLEATGNTPLEFVYWGVATD